MMNSFKNIFQVMRVPALVIKPNGLLFNIVAANNLYLEITGIRESELVGSEVSQIVSLNHEYREDVEDSLQSISSAKTKKSEHPESQLPKHYSFKAMDSFWRFENKPILSEDGELEYILHSLEDITAEILLEEANQRKSHFVENNPDGLYSLISPIRHTFIRDSKGKAIKMVGATSDISNIKAKEEALFIANQRFEMVMKATNEVLWDWDIHNDFVERADSFTETFGYNTKETASMEKFWITRIAEPDRKRVQDSLRTALEDESCNTWKEEYQFYKADGEVSYINDRGVILRDNYGKALRMVGSVVDVTESYRMLKEIQRQNATLKEIAWQQSHVVRAPLARLKGLLELFELGNFDDLNREEIWQLIHSSADELDEIVRKIVIQSEELEYSN